MSTKIASLYAEIGADTSKLQKGLGETKTGLSDVAKSALSTTAIFAAMSTVLVATGKAFKKMVDETVDYGMQVRDMGLLIGASAEESSKLIQAADDVFVSYESLSRGMQIAIRNGVEPTIDGMGRLADQYNSIQDPIERTKFLLDTFGRSGAELAPLMQLGSDGLKELGDEAEKVGLVLDQETIRATIKYKEAVDSLNDTLAGIKMQIGSVVLPALAAYTEAISLALEGTRDFSEWRGTSSRRAADIELLSRAFEAGAIRAEKYRKALLILSIIPQGLKDLSELGDWQLPVFGNFISQLDELRLRFPEIEEGIDKVGYSIANLPKKANAKRSVAELISPFTEALGSISTIISGPLAQELESFQQRQSDIQQQIWDKEQELAKARIGGYSEQGSHIQGLLGELGELETAYKENADAHDEANKRIIFNLLQQRVMSSTIDDEYKLGILSTIGKSMGLWDEATANAITNLDTLVGSIENGSLDAVEDLGLIEDAIINLPTDKIISVNVLVNDAAIKNLIQGLNSLGGMDIISGFGIAPPEPGKAGGGDVYAGKAYPVGELGPELFVPSQNGYIIPNSKLGKEDNNDNREMLRLLQQIANTKAVDEAKLARSIRDAMLQVVG